MPIYRIPDPPPQAIVIVKNDGLDAASSPYRHKVIMEGGSKYHEGIYLIPWCPVGYLPDHGNLHISYGQPDYADKIHDLIANTKCQKVK